LPIFPTPLSFGAFAPYVPFGILREVNREETRVMGLSYREDRMIVAWIVLTQCQRVTDGRTDGFTIANTALCIASYEGRSKSFATQYDAQMTQAKCLCYYSI